MTSPFDGGPLQPSDLLGIWQSVMDDSYTEPFVLAGDGQGMEAWSQAFAQLARVSLAVDVAMESLFILPWSGQTNPPASGPNQATVTLSLSRAGLLSQPLVLQAGTWVDEVAPDWSPTGTDMIVTGLRYSLDATVIFEPGESGPMTVTATAERPGYGYNNPMPGSLSSVEQPGTQYYNVDAAIQSTLPGLPIAPVSRAVATMTVIDVPNVVIPEHVGQYVLVNAGLNLGAIARVVSFRAANPGVDGGAVGLELLFSVHASTFAGTFSVGELVAVGSSGYATFVDAVEVGAILKASFVMRCGTVAPGVVLTGVGSGATATVEIVYTDASTLETTTPSDPPALVPSTEGWRVLDWVVDWGLSVSNAAQPSGGTAGVLDLLGKERDLPRGSGETDEQYRMRVATIADVVTPNAVKRRLNKVLTQGVLGLTWCFREIGTPLFPGFFYDVDFYDYDAQIVNPLSSLGDFQLYEPVTQTTNGVVTTGKLLVRGDVPVTPFVPGQAGTTGLQYNNVWVGMAGLRLGYSFVALTPIVGTISKYQGTTISVADGLGVQYAGNNPSGAPLSNAWRIYVDYLRMRAYFVVTIQRSGAGDFGFGWGSGASGVGALADFWDVGPGWNDFYDGAPIAAAAYDLTAWNAVNTIRAAGVFVEFLPQTGPCV